MAVEKGRVAVLNDRHALNDLLEALLYISSHNECEEHSGEDELSGEEDFGFGDEIEVVGAVTKVGQVDGVKSCTGGGSGSMEEGGSTILYR